MSIKITRLGIATYLAPDFALVEENLPGLDEAVETLRREGVPQIVVNLEHVPVLDSRGLEYLIELSVALRETGGSLRLAGGGPLCREVLAITRTDREIPIYEDLEAAGRSFL